MANEVEELKRKIISFDYAKKIQELGFNEPVISLYEIENKKLIFVQRTSEDFDGYIKAPKVSDSIIWLKENFGITCSMELYLQGDNEKYVVTFPNYIFRDFESLSFENAENKLLKELFEIIKIKNH
jgi:hypothetical protein